MCRHRVGAVLLIAATTLLGPTSVSLAGGTIHLLIAADTKDEKLGEGMKVNLQMLVDVFSEHVPSTQLEVVTLSGDNLSQRSILAALSQFHAERSDALVFFWSGHGGYDQNGHFLAMPSGERLYRRLVVEAVCARGAGSDAVITDCCNRYSPRSSRSQSAHRPPSPWRSPNRSISPLFESLFLRPRGLVDINGASEGQYGFTTGEDGSTFLRPLMEYLETNAEQQISWSTVIRDLQPKVQDAFREAFPHGYAHGEGHAAQRTQTIRVYHLPPGWPVNPARQQRRGVWYRTAVSQQGACRFGVVATDYTGGGVILIHVFPDHPAGDSGLEVGDVILAVNGRPTRTALGLASAVARSPQRMNVVVRDCRTGRLVTVVVGLRY